MAATGPTLKSGQVMPYIGLGTWKIAKEDAAQAVEQAIRMGYRHIDCACDYGNEKEVGQGIKAAIDAGVCTRADLFVTSKLWNTFHAREHVEPACRRTLADLGLDYVNLYLIHFPISIKYVPFETRYPPEWFFDPKAPNPKMELADVPIRETWEAMEALLDKGLTRNIGVSNFSSQLLMELLKGAKVIPAVNQVELHPYLTQDQLVEYHAKLGIVLTGYSPLGAGSYVALNLCTKEESALEDQVIKGIAAAHNKTPAQVILRWGIQRGYNLVPKSKSEARLRENLDVFDFSLTADEVAAITALNRGRRFNDPGVYTKFFSEFCPIFA